MGPNIILLAASLAAAADTLAEAPTSKWRVEYGDTQCLAMRIYGKRTLALRSAPNGESYEIMLLEPGSTDKYASQLDGTVSFSAQPIRSTVLVYSDRMSKTKIYKFRVNAEVLKAARASTHLRLRAFNSDFRPPPIDSRIPQGASGGSADLSLSQMAAVLDKMDECTADLRKHWNDGVTPPVVATPATGNMAGLFSAADYPSEALIRDQGGTTQVILLVDERGKVASCYNSRPSGIASVDSMSCQVITQRGKFAPARDAQGKPVKSIFYSPRITFQMQ